MSFLELDLSETLAVMADWGRLREIEENVKEAMRRVLRCMKGKDSSLKVLSDTHTYLYITAWLATVISFFFLIVITI